MKIRTSRINHSKAIWHGRGRPVLLIHPNRTSHRVWEFMLTASHCKMSFYTPTLRGTLRNLEFMINYGADHSNLTRSRFVPGLCRRSFALKQFESRASRRSFGVKILGSKSGLGLVKPL